MWTNITKSGKSTKFDNLLIDSTDTLLINTVDKLTLQNSSDSESTVVWNNLPKS